MKKIALLLAMGLASVNASAAAISGLYNTGAGLSAGAQDTHYSWTDIPFGTYQNGYVSLNGSFPIAGNWMDNTPASSWLTPGSSQGTSYDPNVPGTYLWVTSFDLTGYDASSASFSARFAADNSAVAYLNGKRIGESAGFTSWSDFSASSTNFVAGVNTLSFVVTNLAQNGGNPTGLRVEFLSSNVTAVPEADTYALMMAGLGLMGLIARRKSVA